jgi:hypothetical protein
MGAIDRSFEARRGKDANMWIGAIRLRVRTMDAAGAGTDHLVTATIVREGVDVVRLALDYQDEDDLQRGAVRNYDYSKLHWDNDETPRLPDGVMSTPMPYPSWGIEFSHGLHGHLKIRLEIHGDDRWDKDDVRLHIREIREVATSFDTVEWREDSGWTHIGTWNNNIAMSSDSDEGFEILNLHLA